MRLRALLHESPNYRPGELVLFVTHYYGSEVVMHSYLLALLFLFQAPNEPKPAIVEGTVLHAAAKTPIRKAKVSLTAIGFEGGGSVETADDGKFTLKDVKPGRYRLTAEKTGYETTAYGARKPGEATGQVIRIDAGAALSGISIALPKHGVIAGKVLDADNEPVPKVLVMALANMYYQNGRRTRLPRGTIPAMSNDLGEYRIGQLPPGKYIICAVPANFLQPTPQEKAAKPAVEEVGVTTCFPNLQQMSEATQLEIKDSTEISAIDVRLVKSRTVSVQGQIIGVPPGAGMVTILNMNAKGSGPIGNALNPRAYMQGSDGKFEFKNVSPGTYVLHTIPTGLGNTPFVVKATVDIGDRPVTDLKVPAIVPFEVKGKVVAEPGPELKMASIRVVLTPADEITSSLAMGTANADGDITLANLVPGRQRVTVAGVPWTHYIKEIRAGDQIAEGDEVEFADSSTPLTVTLAIGPGEITGMVRNEKGDPVPGANVALVPQPRRPFRIKSTRTDQNGIYKLPNVAPGEYLIVALDSVEAGALEDEEYLKPILSKLKKLKVENTEPLKADLPVLFVER
ncbi:MAG: carboxypeptidase regulatory-like domain-containing protein [Acidobacteria bacterium]|nr:carboxypeptidase regulatory-like domain-containing protein [Acidobacteriota bacterium]